MKKNIYILLPILLLVLVGVGACSNSEQIMLPAAPKPDYNTPAEVEYRASQEVFCNPERGFYTYRKFTAGEDESNPLTADFVKGYRNDEAISLVFTTYLMREFIDKPISDAYLQLIEKNLQALRDGGSKCVLRFCYSDRQASAEEEENGTYPYDPTWEVMKGHLQQLKPIFEKHVDVISLLEAGFIGAWGEWYYTTNYIYQPNNTQYGPRKQVLDELLKILPKERNIAIRYPGAKLACYGLAHADSITINEAYKYSDLARVAGHNDCFVAAYDDRGTFKNNAEREYWKKETKYYVMGGETCRPSDYSNCLNTLKELANYHWSYMNISYHRDVIEQWKTEGCYEDIRRNLGYRFVLQNGVFDQIGKAGEEYNMQVNLTNVGYAAPYNPRNLQLVIASTTDAAEKHVIELDEDPRYWFPGEIIKLDLNIKLPNWLKPNKYNIYLNLPDPKEAIADKSEFSIRLANDDVWESNTGYNKLYQFEIFAE